jgi:hypothetical protein
VACALLWTQAASAQSQTPEVGEVDTAVLRFDTDGVDPAVAGDIREAVVEVIDGHREMRVTERPEVTLSEFTLTVGCDSRDPSCLSSLAPYTDASRLVFGTLTARDDLYRVDLGVFDLREGRMVYRIQNETARGDRDIARKAIPALVEGMLYGNVGTVEVKVRGGKGARVAFDGEFRGPAPTVLKNLPLGQHTVSVTTGDGATKSKVVLLTRHGQTRVLFDFGHTNTTDPGQPSSESMSLAPGIVVGAVGLGGIALGIVSNIQLNNLDAEANAAVQQSSNGAYIDRSELQSADGDPETHVRMTRSASVRAAVGYSVGAVGFAVGTYLLYRAIDSETPTARQAGTTLQVAPSIGGRSVGMQLRLSY